MYLPWIRFANNIPTYEQVNFLGIERSKASSDGSIYDMCNINTSDIPVLSATENRRVIEKLYEMPWYYGAVEKEYVIAGKTKGVNYALWKKDTTYKESDIVAYDGVLYIAVEDSPEGEPSTSEDWNIYTETTFSYDGVWREGETYSVNDVVYHEITKRTSGEVVERQFIRNLTGKTPIYPIYDDNWGWYPKNIREWDSESNYVINDIVRKDKVFYIKVSGGNGVPGVDNDWEVIPNWELGKHYSKGDTVLFVDKTDNSGTIRVKLNDSLPNWEPYSYATLYYNGEEVKGLELMPCKKSCAYLNGYIVILPDNMFYNIEDKSFGYLNGTKSASINTKNYSGIYYNNKNYNYPLKAGLVKEDSMCTIKLGFFGGNTLMDAAEHSNIDLTRIFRAGDAINVNQDRQKVHRDYAIIENGTYYVEEVGKSYLKFTPSTFASAQIGEDAEVGSCYYLGDMILSKGLPEIDYICQSNNRLWGCHEDTVYSSALGDVFIWQRYTGLESDPVYIESGDIGSFTGCIEYNGYPIFFKENEMYRVYGSVASTFVLQKVANYGLRADSPNAVCVADSILFFLSPYGVCAFTGGIPGVISSPLKTALCEGFASTDGTKLYLSANDGHKRIIYVYDINNRVWSSETYEHMPIGIVNLNGEVKSLDIEGNLMSISKPLSEWGNEVDTPTAYIEFNDFYESTTDKKHIGRIIIRASVDPMYDALTVHIQYDSDGEWHNVGSIYNQDNRKKVSELAFYPRMCDHYRIKLECNGKFTLYSMTRQIE